MRKILEEHVKKNIKVTKPIYKYDPLNKTNFHQYIDNHPHILVVAKFINGRTIAAYSEGPISSQEVATGSGLLISPTDKKTFYLLKDKKSVTYDPFLVIFGSSEFRLKPI